MGSDLLYSPNSLSHQSPELTFIVPPSCGDFVSGTVEQLIAYIMESFRDISE